MSIKGFVIRSFVNPIIWRYVKGSKRFRYYKEYRKRQWKRIKENEREQRKRLFNIIRYAHQHIPYYRKIIESKKIKYSEKTIFGDIKKFPVLTKKIIRENFKDLVNPKIKAAKNTSGGSTGEQAIFMQDKSMYDHNAATKVLYNEWAGRKEGELIIKLWGSERDVLEGGMGFKGFLVRNFTNAIIRNTYKMSESDMRNHINVINRMKPKMILSYAQAAFEISRFINENNIKVYSPAAFMTSAGTLFPHFRKTIKKAFRCPVFNRYGSREVGDIACECEKHEGLHINTLTQYVEILDKNFRGVKKGVEGEIYVTYLHNYAMPLIRYKIGDTGAFSTKKCSCERGFPMMKYVKGRVGCILRTKKGALDSTALTTSFYFYDSIRKYQMIQRGDKFIIKVVTDPSKDWESDRKKLESKLKKIFGRGTKLTFKKVKEIPSTKSGKYLYFINENEFGK